MARKKKVAVEAVKEEAVEKAKDLDALLDAVKELTKAIADLTKEQKTLSEEIKLKVKAGRF